MPSHHATGRRTSNVLATLLVAFATFCFQGHLTSTFTPTFAAQIAASIGPLNEQCFGVLGLSDKRLNYVFAAINVVNVVSLLLPPRTRKFGLLVNLAFYTLGLVTTWKIGESPVAHVVLVSMCAAAYLLR